MTPALRFFLELTAAYLLIIAIADTAYALGWLGGGTITHGIESLAARHPWLPTAYVAGSLWLVALGYWHFFGR